MKINPVLWVEKYRPTKIEDCILTESLKKVFKGILKTKKITNLLLCGTAGIGKTTVAKALCSELEHEVLFVNASEERGIDVLRSKIIDYASAMSMNGKRKCVILDEGDNLTPDAQAALRGVMEQFSNNCAFIITCNFKDKIIPALHSRCAVHDFRILKQDRKDVIGSIYKRITFILKEEEIKFDSKVLSAIVVKFFPDFRRTINQLQSYSQSENEINEGILAFITEINTNKLCEALKEKKFNSVREWVVENLDNEPARIYRKIYDALSIKLKNDSIPEAIIHLAEYQYQSAFVADQELNLLACLVLIMSECEFV